MKMRMLSAALLAGLAFAQAAGAQEFDDRWYVSADVGANLQDDDRGTDNAWFGALGVGKRFSPAWSFEIQANYQNPDFEENNDLNWSQYGVSFDLRRHFAIEAGGWDPYVLFGVGMQRAEEEFVIPSPLSPAQREAANLAGKIGAGIQGEVGDVIVRTEIAYRADFDDNSAVDPGEDFFGDVLASIGVLIPLGPAPVAAVVPVAPVVAAPVTTCADLDDDGDGVNNCNDKCPGSQAGQTIGPDGCPVPVTIDLRGVNFDFDEATLRPDAIAILNEAIEILKRYPQLRVEVAGHTDLCASEVYNQALSEARSRTVFDYLVSNGVAPARLAGPVGYGESRPLVATPETFPACKSEVNRRVELNAQNQ